MKRTNLELECQRTFYLIAELCRNGQEVPQGMIRDRLGLADSTTSRNIAQLSVGATVANPGPRLVESREDPQYRRRKLVRLTAAGKRFIEAIETIHKDK